MLGWGFRSGLGENFLLSEGVEQSGEQASFAFHHRSAVTALSTTKSGIEQIPEGVAEHVEGVDDKRQAKPRPESQVWRHLHELTPVPAEQTSPLRNRGWQTVSEEAQRRLASRQRLFIFYLTTSVGHGLALCSHDKKNLFRLPFCGNVNIWNLNGIRKRNVRIFENTEFYLPRQQLYLPIRYPCHFMTRITRLKKIVT